MNLKALLDSVEFSQPMSTSTKRGPRLLRKASVTQEFWDIYREDRDDYKQAMGDLGLQLSKFGFSCFTTYNKQHIFFLGHVQSC